MKLKTWELLPFTKIRVKFVNFLVNDLAVINRYKTNSRLGLSSGRLVMEIGHRTCVTDIMVQPVLCD